MSRSPGALLLLPAWPGALRLNRRNSTAYRFDGDDNSFADRTILGADGSLATDVVQRSAAHFEATGGFTITNASCVGTQPGVPCVE